MAVRLISYTPHPEETMAYIARVSSENQDNPSYEGLLKYCLKNEHWSVFQHSFVTLEIITNRAIARQILRHRGFTFSEFSGRYSEMPENPQWQGARRQDQKNRQNSIDDLPQAVKDAFQSMQEEVWESASRYYQIALEAGIAKECARSLLPEGLVQTKLYVSGSVREWITYTRLRSGNGTQKEHQEIAKACQKVLAPVLPTIAKLENWS